MGYRGPIQVRIAGLPSGWVASPETVSGDKNEVTLTIRPDGNNTAPFFKRDAALGPWKALIEAVVDDLPFVVAEVDVIPDPEPVTP